MATGSGDAATRPSVAPERPAWRRLLVIAGLGFGAAVGGLLLGAEAAQAGPGDLVHRATQVTAAATPAERLTDTAADRAATGRPAAARTARVTLNRVGTDRALTGRAVTDRATTHRARTQRAANHRAADRHVAGVAARGYRDGGGTDRAERRTPPAALTGVRAIARDAGRTASRVAAGAPAAHPATAGTTAQTVGRVAPAAEASAGPAPTATARPVGRAVAGSAGGLVLAAVSVVKATRALAGAMAGVVVPAATDALGQAGRIPGIVQRVTDALRARTLPAAPPAGPDRAASATAPRRAPAASQSDFTGANPATFAPVALRPTPPVREGIKSGAAEPATYLARSGAPLPATPGVPSAPGQNAGPGNSAPPAASASLSDDPATGSAAAGRASRHTLDAPLDAAFAPGTRPG